MKNLTLIILFLVIISCKRDVKIEPNNIDTRIGNYQCVETTSSLIIDSIGNFTTQIDTTNKNIIISVSSAPNSNYSVVINSYSFTTSTTLNNQYFANCYSGPCDNIKFYPNDTIVVYRRISNPVSKRYSGKKI